MIGFARRGVIALLSVDAIAGEYITLNYFDGIHADKSTSFRMVWFVDEATQQVLEKSDLSASVDGLTWVRRVRTICPHVPIADPEPTSTLSSTV